MLDSTKERILRNPEDRKKLQEEVRAAQAEMGLQKMVPLKGQNEFQVLDDLKNNAHKIEDQFAASNEVRHAREKARKEEERRKRMQMSEETYFRMKERCEREAYERRKITL